MNTGRALLRFRETLREGNEEEALSAAKRLVDEGKWNEVLAEVIVAASEEVNDNNMHLPIGLPVMRTFIRAWPIVEDKWPLLERAIRFVWKLNKIPPGPFPLLPAYPQVREWSLTEITVELLRVVRKSNYYKVFSILASIPDEKTLFQALYSLASAVPGPRSYNVILTDCLRELYPYVNEEQKSKILLSVVEMITTLVQSARYTSTLLYLVNLNHLNEFVPTKPEQPYGERLAEWIVDGSANEVYHWLSEHSCSHEEFYRECFEACVTLPDQDGLNVLQAISCFNAASFCADVFYFNHSYLQKHLIRELSNKRRAMEPRPPATAGASGVTPYLSLSVEFLGVLEDDELYEAATALLNESPLSRERFFDEWLTAGVCGPSIDLRTASLESYLSIAKMSTGSLLVYSIYRVLQILKHQFAHSK